MRRTLIFGLCILVFMTITGTAQADILGVYYQAGGGPVTLSNANIRGTRVDANINFDWGTGVPGVGGLGVDGFGVSWRGQVNIPTEGNWTFTTNSDDGARLWVNGRFIIDQWVNQGPTDASATVFLTAGRHDITMDYFENGGGAVARLDWAGPGVGRQRIPASALSLPDQSVAGVLGRYYKTTPNTIDIPDPLNTLFATRVDPNINFNFDSETIPGIGVDDLATRWNGRIFIPTGGNWRFRTRTDDGARVYIDTNDDNNLEYSIDNWILKGVSDVDSGTMFLGAGFYDFCMEYFENGGGAAAQIQWEGPGVGFQNIPGSAFYTYNNGFIAELRNNTNFSGDPVIIRYDDRINSDYGTGSPQTRIGGDNFSIRWLGKIRPPASGSWTFYTNTDDGVDLYVNGVRIINDLNNGHPATEFGGTINLNANTNYFIRMDYQELTGGAVAQLRWSGPGISKRLIAKDYVFPIQNEAPANIALNPGQLNDTDGANAVAGLLSTTDPDNTTGGSQTHSYALVGGAGSTNNGLFNINGTQLRQNNSLAVGSYSVRVRTTDNGRFPDYLTFAKALTVTVLDNTPPVITLTGGNLTVNCGSGYSEPGYSATDNVDGNITGNVAVGGQTVNTAVPGAYVVRYNVSDAASNAAIERTRTVTVQDVTNPVITRTGAATVQVECGANYVDAGATATDGCDDNVSLSAAISVTGLPIDTSSTGSHIVSYNVSDAASNPATTVTRTVQVVDTIAPAITLNGGDITIECGSTYNEMGATAFDTCAGSVAVNITGSVNTLVSGPHVLTYAATDGTNNASTTRTVTVEDNLPPVIALNGSANVSVVLNGSYTELGAVATDACEGSVAVVTGGDTVDTSTVGTYVVTYNAQDSGARIAAEVTRTVNVVLGNPPAITLLGSPNVSVECKDSYSDAGATASDPEDGVITGDIVTVNPVDTDVPAVYTITYNVSDISGNPATEVTRTVTVEDTTPPAITLIGGASVSIACGTVYSDAGATASDGCDGSLTSSITTSSNVNPNSPGNYTVTYNVLDAASNAAAEVVRNVEVTDAEVPVLSLIGLANITLDCGDPYTDDGAAATDNCDDDLTLTSAITVTGLPIQTSNPGLQVVTYNVSDSAGNPAASIVRNVTVADSLAPEITVQGSATLSLTVGATFADPGAFAIDECEGTLPVTVGGDVVDTSQVGIYFVTYDAQDSTGNMAPQRSRTVFVGAGLPPVFTQQPANQFVNYGDDAQFSVVAAGLGTLFYQWQRDGVELVDGSFFTGTETANLTVLSPENSVEGDFVCTVTSQGTSITSGVGELTVLDPAIITHPVGETVLPGSTVVLNVVAVGSGTLTYQWSLDGVPLVDGPEVGGVDTDTLTLTNVQENTDEGDYTCEVDGGEDAAIVSDAARLQVGNPSIILQPLSAQLNPGDTAQFIVGVVGTEPIEYVWKKNGVNMVNVGNVSGARTNTLTITNVSEADEADYTCLVVGENIVESNKAGLLVLGPPVIDGVESIPSNGIVPLTETVTVSVLVSDGVQPFTYQWLKNGTPLSNGGRVSGVDEVTLRITSVQASDAGNYRCLVTNSAGQRQSPVAFIKAGLTFTQQLFDQLAEQGRRFTWTVQAAGGQDELEYQWLKDDGSKTLQPLTNVGPLDGTDTNTLIIDPVDFVDAGTYVVQAGDGVDVIQSLPAELGVVETLPISSTGYLLLTAMLVAFAGVISIPRRQSRKVPRR